MKVFKSNKNQITLVLSMIIITVLAFILVASSNFLNSGSISPASQNNNDVIDPINLYVETCLEHLTIEAITFTSFQGGYYETSEPFLNYYSLNIPYYFYFGEQEFPLLETLEEQIGMYIEDQIHNCISDFNIFKEQGYLISGEIQSVEFSIQENNVDILLNYPLSIERNKLTTKIEQFHSTVDFNLKQIYEIVQGFAHQQENSPNLIPSGYLTEMAENEDFTFEIVHLEDDTVLFTLLFEEKKALFDTFIFNFGVKYDWDYLKEK